jgi:hypothetical protein
MSSLYQDLQEGKIRLFQLTSHDGIAATLEMQTFSQQKAIEQEYDALTYAWGKTKSVTPISCIGN